MEVRHRRQMENHMSPLDFEPVRLAQIVLTCSWVQPGNWWPPSLGNSQMVKSRAEHRAELSVLMQPFF
jgi:hypothetical protein